MRPHHLILVCLGVVGLPTLFTFFSLLHAHPRGEAATEVTSDPPKTGIRAFFSFHSPSTLFPPSAIISLTDDNSTFFLARPADFGPSLHANGLSGQLWIGSGFGDDSSGRAAPDTGAEGELGCSDVPGWEDGGQSYRKDQGVDPNVIQEGSAGGGQTSLPTDTGSDDDQEPSRADGTDDHLHHPLPSSPVSRPAEPGQTDQHASQEPGHPSTHADIQSLQESAEISGRVVLLSRGGCGFLEKVKWAQRRGATALIVGDHTRGGALITMYARGDTSNVTIPSLFTSHTTAHLLSSLIPPASPVDEPDTMPGKGSKSGNPKSDANGDRPTFTPISLSRPTSIPSNGQSRKQLAGAKVRQNDEKSNWLKVLFASSKTHSAKTEDSRRPPSSGRLDWFGEKRIEESFKGKDPSSNQRRIPKSTSNIKIESTLKETSKAASHQSSGDDFVIGVQDWRDPDLVATKPSSQTKSTTTTRASALTPMASKALYKGSDSAEQNLETALRGGSITPGSGQYQKPGTQLEVQVQKEMSKDSRKQFASQIKSTNGAQGEDVGSSIPDSEEHEGLWVTLTPTTVSTSPFFDTLLVLVVSPLVTLTVVYALLLLRSRIRRRRWRAPKSVVDRLPIRTYHTMSCASTSLSSGITTPQTSSPTTPLLHSSSRSITARSRPRSATATGIEDAISASVDRAATASITQQEKRAAQSRLKKKYHGKQLECVVCLEEYVDGESRVMSLPCGHEFHAECITPWLTTRRRTCPICKGDVVRSMAQSSSNIAPSANHQGPYLDNPGDTDVQAQAAESTNESPSAAIPIPRDIDLEQGDDLAATLVNDQAEASTPRSRWRGLAASMSLSAFAGEAAWRQDQEDRNR